MKTTVQNDGKNNGPAPVRTVALAGLLLLTVLTPAAPTAQTESNSFNFDRIAVQSLLPILAEAYEVNLIQTGEVPGFVSLSIEDRPLRSVLGDVLLGTGFTYHLANDRLRVIPGSTLLDITIPLGRLDAIEAKETLADIRGGARIAADRISNSLAVVGPAADLRRIEDALLRFDVNPRQVQILGRMIEINLTDHQALGIDWSSSWDDNVQSASGATRLNIDPTPNIIMNYSRLTDWELEAVLNAIETNTDSRIISRPLLVMSNQETAKILVGERVPYTRFVNETDAGGIQEEVDFIDVGVQLEVTAIISDDSLITLTIDAELSQVLDKEVQGIPRIGSREAHTRIAVRSGETAVIGGLRKEDLTITTRGIPYLSSIPFLGRLFRSEDEVATESELIIFLTATVVDIGSVPKNFQTANPR